MAVFFRDVDEDPIPLDEEEISRLKVANGSFRDEHGREVVRIDDQRFVVDDLSTRGFSARRWPNGKVYYDFDANVNSAHQTDFVNACREWEDNDNTLDFVLSGTASNCIHVRDGPENSADVGMLTGGQTIEIHDWHALFTIVHEIGHALGLSHEQCRDDRDTFVEIVTMNIQPGRERNFDKQATVQYTDYDFESLMHYGPNAWSIPGTGPTIRAKPDSAHLAHLMGNNGHLTASDRAGMAARYPAPYQTQVPNVRELRREAAGRLVRNAGLVPKFTGDSGANTYVFRQNPGAGTTVSNNTTVTMRMRKGDPL